MLVDCTDDRLLEERWLRGQKREALGVLAAGIALDLNNVMGAIIGNAELAQNELKLRRSPAESVGEIQQASRRAGDVLHRLLTFWPRNHQQTHCRQPQRTRRRSLHTACARDQSSRPDQHTAALERRPGPRRPRPAAPAHHHRRKPRRHPYRRHIRWPRHHLYPHAPHSRDARVILFDEPFTGLDTTSQQRLEGLLAELASQGRALLIATHDVRQAASWDRVLCINGRQVAFGPADTVLTADTLAATYGGALVE